MLSVAPSKSESVKSPTSPEKDADIAAISRLRDMGVADGNSPSTTGGSGDSETFDEDSNSQSSVIATVPAKLETANLYLPQAEPQKKNGILSRLFHLGKSRETPKGQSFFNSDYATRNDNVTLPAALDGNGFNGKDLPIGGEDPYRFATLPASFRPTDLVKLPVQNCHYHNQLYLRREAAVSLCSMINAAAQDGMNISVVSAYRDIGHQTRLYTQAVSRGGEDQQDVARPGRSEHNLGTTVDLTNDESHALNRNFQNTSEWKWLAGNATRFGWKMTVMSTNARRSHNQEPWHLRYYGRALNGVSPISSVAQPTPARKRLDVFGSIGRFLHLRR